MDPTGLAYLALSAIIIVIALAMYPAFGPGIYTYLAIIIIMISLVMLMLMNWVDFLVFPAIMNMLGIVFKPSPEYRIVKSQDAIIKTVSGINYATGYVTANLFGYEFKAEQEEENMDDKIADSSTIWERALMSIDFPFKFHIISASRDVQKARDELEGKRSYQEFQMNKTIQGGKSADSEVADIQRKMNMIQTQMDRIAQGEKPISTLMYMETIGVGVSEKEALDNLSSQINRLQIAMGGFDLSFTRIVGRELYTLFKFNFGLPVLSDEMAQYFDTQG